MSNNGLTDYRFETDELKRYGEDADDADDVRARHHLFGERFRNGWELAGVDEPMGRVVWAKQGIVMPDALARAASKPRKKKQATVKPQYVPGMPGASYANGRATEAAVLAATGRTWTAASTVMERSGYGRGAVYAHLNGLKAGGRVEHNGKKGTAGRWRRVTP